MRALIFSNANVDRKKNKMVLLWLWCRLAATAPTGPLAWEPIYAEDAALKKDKRQKKGKKKKKKRERDRETDREKEEMKIIKIVKKEKRTRVK